MVVYGEEAQILSERHREILKERLAFRIKTVTGRDIATIQRVVLTKLEDIHSSRDFAVIMVDRVKILYEMLFDKNFPKSKETEKAIAAGLLYFISPEDFLPDDIPGLGYLDDAYVINEVWDMIHGEIQKFLAE